LGGGEGQYYDSIRFSFCSPISFVGLTVEQALRHFLTNAHFRLPGEAQKIDRLINTFANCWWADNISKATNTKEISLNNNNNNSNNNRGSLGGGVAGGSGGIWEPNNVDSVYLLAFAVIMLNTDLHRAANKKHKKMTKTAFVYNLTRGDDSLPRDLLEEIYDSVAAEQIKMPVAGAAPTLAEEKEKAKSNGQDDKIKFQNSFKQSLLRSEELFQGLSL
jgi:Sec7-like guanine-nucleotide exchange factor